MFYNAMRKIEGADEENGAVGSKQKARAEVKKWPTAWGQFERQDSGDRGRKAHPSLGAEEIGG